MISPHIAVPCIGEERIAGIDGVKQLRRRRVAEKDARSQRRKSR
jgi:hypothetical protein